MKAGEICPNCGQQNNIYINSRVRETGFRKRRKQCLCCGTRWTTVEIMDEKTKPFDRTYEVKKDDAGVYIRCMETEEVIKLISF